MYNVSEDKEFLQVQEKQDYVGLNNSIQQRLELTFHKNSTWMQYYNHKKDRLKHINNQRNIYKL